MLSSSDEVIPSYSSHEVTCELMVEDEMLETIAGRHGLKRADEKSISKAGEAVMLSLSGLGDRNSGVGNGVYMGGSVSGDRGGESRCIIGADSPAICA